MSFGKSSNRWSNVYTNTLNVSSNSLVANLNADMVDGLHVDDIMVHSTSILTSGGNIFRVSGYGYSGRDPV